MIRIKGSGAIYGDVWFDEDPPADPNVDILRYYCRHAPIAAARSVPFLSMVTDLGVEPEAIADTFSKDCRYKVRRADSKDGLKLDWILDPRERLQEFREFFDAFARQKSHEPCDQQWLQAACDAGQLVLTTASRDGEALVWHAYLISGKSAWLQYSGSCFRDKQNDYRALVGRANRWLHWKAMLHFKDAGMARYDWGGLFEDESTPERAGINAFKKSFGGHVDRTYQCTVPVTIKGRLYLPLRDAWRNRKTALQARKVSAATA
jgi:lipid II:glycine glycyltransferase (peptidoglycan interpeptide bridge formation enzyme)